MPSYTTSGRTMNILSTTLRGGFWGMATGGILNLAFDLETKEQICVLPFCGAVVGGTTGLIIGTASFSPLMATSFGFCFLATHMIKNRK